MTENRYNLLDEAWIPIADMGKAGLLRVFGGREWNLDIYHRDGMRPDHRLCGPAVVVELTSTTVVPPDWTCEIDENQSLVLKKARA